MCSWDREEFWAEVEREIAALDPDDFESFRAADGAGLEPEPERCARLRRRILGAPAGGQ